MRAVTSSYGLSGGGGGMDADAADRLRPGWPHPGMDAGPDPAGCARVGKEKQSRSMDAERPQRPKAAKAATSRCHFWSKTAAALQHSRPLNIRVLFASILRVKSTFFALWRIFATHNL
jgi:hypothetical protein